MSFSVNVDSPQNLLNENSVTKLDENNNSVGFYRTMTDSEALSLHPSERPSILAKRKTPKSGAVAYSTLLEYQQFPCMYMEGYLMKAKAPGLLRRRNSLGFFGNLSRRFFVLQGAFLTYFKSHRDKKPTKDFSIDMRGRHVFPVDNHKYGFHYGFQIDNYTNECLFLLFTNDGKIRDVWLDVLLRAAKLPK